MRIAIEATCLADAHPTGIPRYTRNLLLALAEIQRDRAGATTTLLYKASRHRKRHRFPRHPHLRHQAWHRGVWPLVKNFDVVHIPHQKVPPWPRIPRVATFHDLYALIGVNFDDRAERDKHVAIYHLLAREADHLVFVSEHTRSDFMRLIGGDPRRLHVTPLGVDARFRVHSAEERAAFRQRHGLAEPYLLFLGWQNPNKNMPRLLEAFARSALQRDHTLVLAGTVPADQRALLDARIAKLGIAGRVLMPGYFPEDAVPALYASAEALLFPSLYEGFGLPILEAMASGVPVLTSTVSSCPEVARGHAVLVDPYSVDDIARGIDAVVRVPAEARRAARDYAATMTWTETAQRTLEVYRKAIADGPRARA